MDRVATCNGVKPDRTRRQSRRVARKRRRPPPNAEPAPGDGRASPLFSQDILQHRLVQRQVRHKPLELCVLIFELLQSDLRDAHPGVDLPPPVERRFGDVHLAADLADRRSSVRLPQGKGDLLTGLPHIVIHFMEQNLRYLFDYPTTIN